MAAEERIESAYNTQVALARLDERMRRLEDWSVRTDDRFDKILKEAKDDRHELANKFQIALDALRIQMRELHERNTKDLLKVEASLMSSLSMVQARVDSSATEFLKLMSQKQEVHVDQEVDMKYIVKRLIDVILASLGLAGAVLGLKISGIV